MVNPNNQTNQEELKKNSLTSQSKSTLWVPSNMKWTMVNLVQTSRLQNKTEDLQKIILQWRWTQEILTTSPCLGKTGVSSVINDVKEEYDHISDEDIELGLELYSYLHYCQREVVESAELSVFFEMLFTNHSLETLVASTMNSIQPRVGQNLKDLTAMNMWDGVCMFFIYASFIEFILVNYLARWVQDPEQQKKKRENAILDVSLHLI